MRDLAARESLRSSPGFVEFKIADCHQSIPQRFEQQVNRSPEAPAVRLATGDISYRRLNADANRAARALLETMDGATARDPSLQDAQPVALLTSQGYASIVWTLAILKAGCCYAPLDQRLPISALRRMFDHLAPTAIVADPTHLELAHNLAGTTLSVIDVTTDLTPFAAANLARPVSSDAIAYVFYTSGSTGAPKGVADTHRSVLHNVLRYTNSLKFAPGDVLSLVQNPSFSGTVSTLFGGLLSGAAVGPFDLQSEGLPRLSQWLKRSRATVFHGVPSIFRQLADPATRFADLRLVRLEGDRATHLDVEHFRANFSAHCTLVNGLGATECGLVRQFFIGKETSLDTAEPVPIGYPVSGVQVRIVDERGAELPPNSAGEILVESEFLAAGYWHDPALTAEKFTASGNGQRRYRTGDLGHMSADGCLFHLGRVDQRLRIAGEFVDASEIEKALLNIVSIKQCAVSTFEDRSGERRLCAYIVTNGQHEITVTELRAALITRLSPKLMPAAFVYLDALPLTKDLKVDLRRLPPPTQDRPRLANDFTAPSSELERKLARLGSEVLEVTPVGLDDSFFDLGADSLRIARLASRFQEAHGHPVKVTDLFEHRTIRTLAEYLNGAAPAPLARPTATINALRSAHEIAIIGMAGRFPGADSVDQFWDNLRAGRESLTITSSEPGKVAARGLLSDVDHFDAALFRLTPRQAAMLDPQQRLWLECVHRAVEDAGLPLDESGYAGEERNVGVFVGGRESSYLWHLAGGNPQAVQALLQRSSDEAHQLTIANDTDSLATRTSFVFGFHGPSINVQTACSTSLVAVAQACQALASGQCDLAVAGGVAVSFPQEPVPREAQAGIHSRDGHCRAFDAAATGAVFGDGVGAVVFKRLADALAAGDRIDAVIRGWAVNNDGANKASFAAPSVRGQTDVIVHAQEHARVAPRDIGYVEAHGTGTPVGDPIEFAALTRAFRRATDARGFCVVGAVKTNIGHLDAAAGVAGLIKTVLVLRHGEIPPTLHFRKTNPEIDLEVSPFVIADRVHSWTSAAPRIAGVSSFGVGGTNCHMILQEAGPVENQPPLSHPAQLLTLSAASEEALNALETDYEEFLSRHNAIAAITAATQRSRSRYAYRTAVVGRTAEELHAGLNSKQSAQRWRGRAQRTSAPALGFLFAGQGTQYAGMGKALYKANAEFRRALDRCGQILHGELPRPLLEVMFAGPDDLLQRTEYAQPALFALEYALVCLLRSWGIEPRFVMGHSIGEYTAACVAGVFNLEDGLTLAAKRGRLMQQLPDAGTMLAVTAPQAQIAALLAPWAEEVSIAAINSPTQAVVSGPSDSIEKIRAALQAEGFYYRDLAVSHAFHSAQMTPALEPLRSLFTTIECKPPQIPLFSNLYGRAVSSEVTRPEHWRDHARQPVQWAAGMDAMVAAGCQFFVEIGPNEIFSQFAEPNIEIIPTLQHRQADDRALLETVARLYVRGATIDWRALQGDSKLDPVRLPHYPFQRQRHWYDGPLLNNRASSKALAVEPAGHPLLGRRLRLPGSSELRFENRFSQTAPHFLSDHRLFGVSLPPGASHFAMLAEAAHYLRDDAAAIFRFEDLYMLRPLLLPDGCERDVQLIFRPQGEGWSLELTSADAQNGTAQWTAHMSGFARVERRDAKSEASSLALNAIQQRCRAEITSKDFYSRIWANQGGTGSAFRWVDAIWRGEREALCRALCPGDITNAVAYRLHPGLVEAACQVLHACETIETVEAAETTGATFVPFSVDALILFDAKASHARSWCHAQLRDLDHDNVLADLAIFNDGGVLVARLEGFRLRRITRASLTESATQTPAQQQPTRTSETLPAQRTDDGRQLANQTDVVRYLQLHCAELSGYPESQIAMDQSFMALGLDSLVAMMLANQLRRDFAVSIPVTQILLSKSLETLADEIWLMIAE